MLYPKGNQYLQKSMICFSFPLKCPLLTTNFPKVLFSFTEFTVKEVFLIHKA